tara:strand:- start:4243 stop:4662 length:420 start_codon:yes stop_codon:yes gene_type:complete
MISVINCFDVFNKKIKKYENNSHMLPFIELLVKGIEVDLIDQDYIKKHILHVDLNGTLMICKEHKNAFHRSLPFNNIECYQNDEYVTLFNITNNETFYKLKFNIERSAHIFSTKYNELVVKFNNYKKLPSIKNSYIKLE